MGKVMGGGVRGGGMRVPRGGGQKLADALVAYIREQGGTCETGAEVQRVFPTGVRTADDTTIGARRAVICNVTPRQLYGDLLDGQERPRFRQGRAGLPIHLALS